MHPCSISRFHPERVIERSQELHHMIKIREMSKTKLKKSIVPCENPI
jgi:hypothetical protein